MKKYLAVFFLILTIWFASGPLKAFAEAASVVSKQINARILPLVWYSTLSINDGDSIKIYAGIQNNSGINFTGTATFYVDDKDISDSPFTSAGDSLNAVSASWMADPGSHDVQVKIVTSLPSDKILVSYESAKSSINITRKITQEVVQDTIINTISNVISKVDEVAVPLANKIEAFKKPVSAVEGIANQGASVYNAQQKKNSAVLDVSTGPVSSSDTTINNSSQMDSVFNMALDGLAFLVKHWLWTLGGIILLFLIIKITIRKKK